MEMLLGVLGNSSHSVHIEELVLAVLQPQTLEVMHLQFIFGN